MRYNHNFGCSIALNLFDAWLIDDQVCLNKGLGWYMEESYVPFLEPVEIAVEWFNGRKVSRRVNEYKFHRPSHQDVI